ncbi:OprB family porin [Zymomonas mobilis]|uniref:OprB family porin n=2 Tax=Zymomonas mobilis TaxID=542 RepID=A0A542VZ91_ZYMMB|nr:OprB family porin [Zymomonas mobilis]
MAIIDRNNAQKHTSFLKADLFPKSHSDKRKKKICAACSMDHSKTDCLRSCLLLASSFFILPTNSAAAAQPDTQIQRDSAKLGNSTPLVSQIDPAAARDSKTTAPAPTAENKDKLDTSGNLLGDMGGIRTWLYKYGITFDLEEYDELWGNVSGGTSGKPAYEAVTAPTVRIDLEKLIGLKGGLFNVSALQTRGRSISQEQLSVYNPVSGFEADRSTRLFELWYQQSFFHDKLDIKIGQQDLDTEFLISDYGALYLNANFGWPMAPSVNLYGGGPAWPLASPAIRFRYRPNNQLTVLFAAADDNPSGHSFYNTADPTNQSVHSNGANFNMSGGAFLIAELQYAINPQPEDMSNLTENPGLPGIYRLGGFYDTGRFPDQRYDTNGNLLASPDSTGNPRMHRGNWMIYGIIDQMIWRPSLNSPTSLGVFVRPTGNMGDRNLVSFAIDAGFNLKAPFKGRNNDTVGIAWGMGRTSSRQRAYDRDLRYFNAGTYQPIAGTEHHIELTYQAQITPWMVLQPDLQYIVHPSGGVLNANTGKQVGNEVVFGLHSNISF